MNVATPRKLRDGSWGCAAPEGTKAGEIVEIRTKAGKSWTATVEKVLWSGNGVAICATESTASRRSRSGCDCDDDCCSGRCRCSSRCNCRGGNIYDC